MASRQGGPGRDDAPGSGTADPLGPVSPGTDLPQGERPDTAAPRTGRDTSRRSPRGPYRQETPRPSRRTASDPPLRDPGLYALTDHFRERLGQPGRYVSTRTVSDAIRHGQLRWNRTDGWRFAVVRDGVRFVVVVSDTETASPVVVTAWTEIADRSVAVASPRWDATDIDTITVRTALSESSSTPIPNRIRPRDVSRPFVVGGHEIETAPGEPFVRCTQCGRRFRSKDDLTERRCRPTGSGR